MSDTLTVDESWMQLALNLAQRAEDEGEVPVGAVVIYQGELVGEGYNQSITGQNPCAHAEVMALQAAAKTLGNYRLVDTQLFVTLEPCLMCVGAMVHARVGECIFGAYDPKTGVASSVLKGFELPFLNHQVNVRGGIFEEACSQKLKDFFKKRR